jgi:hypothetical protein
MATLMEAMTAAGVTTRKCVELDSTFNSRPETSRAEKRAPSTTCTRRANLWSLVQVENRTLLELAVQATRADVARRVFRRKARVT